MYSYDFLSTLLLACISVTSKRPYKGTNSTLCVCQCPGAPFALEVCPALVCSRRDCVRRQFRIRHVGNSGSLRRRMRCLRNHSLQPQELQQFIVEIVYAQKLVEILEISHTFNVWRKLTILHFKEKLTNRTFLLF